MRDDARFQCVGYSEVCPYALRVYRTHYPTHPYLGDVRNVTAPDAKVDLIVAGFPCTDLSAMKQIKCDESKRGLDAGGQSSLFFELLRVIKACAKMNPAVHVVCENVHSMKADVRARVTACLKEALGDRKVHVRCIDAAHFSPQRRKRLFWTTFPVPAPTTTGPLFRDVVSADPDPRLYLKPRSYALANALSPYGKGDKKHSRKTVTLPTFHPIGTTGWYAREDTEFKLSPSVRARNRWSNDYLAVSTLSEKSRTLTQAGLYVTEYNAAGHMRIRRMTDSEQHKLFNFPPGYCGDVHVKGLLAHSIVVGVLQYICTHYPLK